MTVSGRQHRLRPMECAAQGAKREAKGVVQAHDGKFISKIASTAMMSSVKWTCCTWGVLIQ